jgi:hypothetical protein
MSSYDWVECLAWAETDGTAYTGNGSLVTLLPPAAKYITPGSKFWRVGKALRITAAGRISNIVTTPGTLTLAAAVGPTANIAAFTSQALALNIVAKTNVSWWLDLLLTCRSIGSGTAATIMGEGRFESESLVIPVAGWIAGNPSAMQLPASAPAAGTGFDSTVASVIDLQANFSLTGNAMTLHNYRLYAEN